MLIRKQLGGSLATALLGVAMALPLSSVQAQEWPSKPVRIVHTSGGGSMSDIFSRIVADGLASSLGQSVVVEGKPGGSGVIASAEVARAAPDGYTLLIGTMSSHVMNPILLKPSYDAVRDFAPVAMLATTPLVLVTNKATTSSLNELITLSKRPGNTLTFASWGNASLSHLAAELMMASTGGTMTHVPYKSAVSARVDLMAERVSIMFSDMIGMNEVKSGRLKVVGTTGSNRASAYPDVPTLAELGLNGYETLGWFAIYAPAATPKPIVARLSKEVATLFTSPEFRKRIQDLGVEPTYADPQQLAERMKTDAAKWSKLVRDKNIKVD